MKIITCWLACLCLILTGCGKRSGMNPETKNALLQFGLTYHYFNNANNRSPENSAELLEFVKTKTNMKDDEAALAQFKETIGRIDKGELKVVWVHS